MTSVSMPRPIPVLYSRLVTLRPPNPTADAGDYFEMNRDPEMHVWTGNEVHDSERAAKNELEHYLLLDSVSTWMIVDNQSQRVVGRFFLTLDVVDAIRIAGEGNRVSKPFWRKGHNRAARALMFQYCFAGLNADLIETEVWSGNANSVKSIEAHGFRLDRAQPNWNPKHGGILEKRYYRMSRERWQGLYGEQLRAGQTHATDRE